MLLSGFVSPPTWSRAAETPSTCSSTGARYAIACSCMPSPKRIAIPSPKSVIRWCLCLTLPPQDIDVNVHPHKTEVRFVQPDLVHAVVREAIQRGLSRTTDSVSSAAVTEFAATSHRATPALPMMPQEWPTPSGELGRGHA